MIEFDWRPLIFLLTIAAFMLLWIVGCTIVTESGTRSAPTQYPPMTLTVGRIETRLTPTQFTPSAASAGTIAPFASPPTDPPSLSIAATAATTHLNAGRFEIKAMRLHPPRCFETINGATRCLGRVDNPFSVPLSGVSVELRLGAHANDAVQTAVIEQAIIPAGGFAPYRVDFAAAWNPQAAVSVALKSAEPAPASAFTSVAVDDVRIAERGSIRAVSALLRSRQPVSLSRAVISLIDDQGAVYGYQVLRFEGQPLDVLRPVALRTLIVPQSDLPMLHVVIHAEARK
ncbi:MAG: hypothetical protein SF162_09105 [bacterium]|nr:hypothetical protein [bacterium]